MDLIPICEVNSMPCLHVDDINSEESIEWIKGLNPDVIFFVLTGPYYQKRKF